MTALSTEILYPKMLSFLVNLLRFIVVFFGNFLFAYCTKVSFVQAFRQVKNDYR